MEEDLRELFQEDGASTTITSEITAEILKIEGEEGSNVIEFRRKDGSPQLYNDHVALIINHMQQEEDTEDRPQQAAATTAE